MWSQTLLGSNQKAVVTILYFLETEPDKQYQLYTKTTSSEACFQAYDYVQRRQAIGLQEFVRALLWQQEDLSFVFKTTLQMYIIKLIKSWKAIFEMELQGSTCYFYQRKFLQKREWQWLVDFVVECCRYNGWFSWNTRNNWKDHQQSFGVPPERFCFTSPTNAKVNLVDTKKFPQQSRNNRPTSRTGLHSY